LSGGLKNNRAFIGDCVEFGPNVAPDYQSLLFDPQTSGGLLVAIDARAAELARQLLQQYGALASPVGIVTPKKAPLLLVN
jgi:selenide,water dikinase